MNICEPSDERLIEQALRGDTSAFGTLVRRWYGPVLAFCQTRMISPFDAEDAVQESFLRAHRQLAQLREPQRFGAWLQGIAGHVCVDTIRKLSRGTATVGIDLAEMPAGDDGPARSAADLDEREHLIRTLHELPDSNREVLLLHYFNDMTYDEMADWLGVARSTVNERLRNGREMLRRRMLTAQRGVDGSPQSRRERVLKEPGR